MSILTVIQTAMLRCGQTQPSQAVSNSDAAVQQFMSISIDIGQEMQERKYWSNLNIAATITGDGSTTLFALPTDWGGLSPGQKLFSNLYPTLPLYGPVTNETLAAMKASPAFPTRPVWRVVGGTMEIWPALGSGEVVSFNYYSVNWVSDSTGSTRKPTWTLDSDFCVMDERTLMRGIVWMWKQTKGLDYAEDFRRYELSLDRAVGREDTERIVAMSARPLDVDGWFPGQITYLGP